MNITPSIPLKENEVRLPDGNVVTKESIRAGLVDGVAATFRAARKSAYSSKDWIRAASEQVVDHLFEVDAFFDQMLEVQKRMAKDQSKILPKFLEKISQIKK